MKSFKQFFLEALPGVSPEQEQDVINKSFSQNVISDILAGASLKNSPKFEWGDCDTCPFSNVCDKATKGDVISSEVILKNLQERVPDIPFMSYIKIDPKVSRVVIKFDQGGLGIVGSNIHIPPQLNKLLGPIIILHEIAHKLYSIDILTKEIVDHPLASEIFTLARTIEDVRVENLMEAEFPETQKIFKERAQYIVPLYKSHTPGPFAKIVDDLFLYLRGYAPSFSGDKKYVKMAEEFIAAGNDRDKKVSAIIKLGEAIAENEKV